MPIQMVRAESGHQDFRANPKEANEQSMDQLGASTVRLMNAQGPTGKQCVEHVRLPDGSVVRRQYQPGFTSHIGAALNHRRADTSEISDAGGEPSVTPGVGADAVSVEGLLAPDGPGSTIDTGA